MRLWTYAVREAQQRPGRTLLTLCGIALGLATVVSTRLTVHTIHRACHDLFEESAGPPLLEVTAAGGEGEGFAAGNVGPLETTPGVLHLRPCVRGVVTVTGAEAGVPVSLVGVAADEWRNLTALADGVPPSPEAVLVDAHLADSLGLKPADAIALWTPTGPGRVSLGGILPARGSSLGRFVVPLATAQRLLGLGDKVSSVQLVLDAASSPEVVEAQVAQRLPPGFTVQGPGQRGQLVRHSLFSTEQALDYLSLLALVGAGFVVLNTFMLNLNERRPQLALLRTLGARRRQVLRVLLSEAAVFGLAGTLAGWAGGLALAYLLVGVLERFSGLALPALELTPGPFVLALLLGPGTALVAALIPAWRASRREPLDELRPPCNASCRLVSCRVAQVGFGLLMLGVLAEVALCFGWVPGAAGNFLPGPVLACLLAGCVLALPLAVVCLLQTLERLPVSLEASLALKLLARRPARTGLSAGVLFLALAVAVGFGHTIQGIVRDLQHWFGHTIVADYLVRASMPDTAFTLAAALPESLGDDLAGRHDVAAVDKLSFIPCMAANQQVLAMARTFSPEARLALDLQEGSAAAVQEELARGDVVLGTNLAQRLHLGRGDTITLETAAGPRALRIAGTVTEYAAGGMALYLEWQNARRLLGLPGVHCYLVTMRHSGDAAGLQSFCREHALHLQSNGELRRQVEALLDRVVSLLWGFMGLAFLVASLGVLNTLTMNVQEQRRDFGVLRALGLKGGQVRKVVLFQALILGGLGLVPGSLAGGGLAYAINANCQCWGSHSIALRPDAVLIGGCWLLTLVTALAAGLIPAWRAARLPVVQAINQ